MSEMLSEQRQPVVLVVDSDAAVRRLARRLLEEDGYTVIDVAHGPTALSTWQTCRDAVDLAIVDVPASGVAEFIELVKRDRPSLPVISMSTFPDRRLAGVSFLRKPFGAAELQNTAASLIKKPPAS